jgi:hypothetical protein
VGKADRRRVLESTTVQPTVDIYDSVIFFFRLKNLASS